MLGYGFERNVPAALRGRRVQRLVGRNLSLTAGGLAFDVATPWGDASIESALIGRFNAANLLGTLGVLLASEHPLDASVAALSKVKPVRGAPSAKAAAQAARRRRLRASPMRRDRAKALRDLMPREGTGARPSASSWRFGCGGTATRNLRDDARDPARGQVIVTSATSHRGPAPDIPTSRGPIRVRDRTHRSLRYAPHRGRALGDVISVAQGPREP